MLKLGANENKQTEYTKKLMKKNPHWKMHGGKKQVQQYDQDSGRGLGLAEYAMWKLDTKLVAWVSSDMGIYSDSSLVSSYPS